MKNLIILLLAFCFISIITTSFWGNDSLEIKNDTNIISRKWDFSGKDKIGILILDFNSFKPKRIYSNLYECRNDLKILSDDSLKEKAITFIESIWPYWPRNNKIDAISYRNTINQKLKIDDYDKFVLFDLSPSDFGGFFLYHRCSGLLVFAGSIVWNGTGKQFFPGEEIDLNYLEINSDEIENPKTIQVVSPEVAVSTEDGIEAFNYAKKYNFVKDYSNRNYHVLIIAYAKRVGFFDPNYAEWIIILYRS